MQWLYWPNWILEAELQLHEMPCKGRGLNGVQGARTTLPTTQYLLREAQTYEKESHMSSALELPVTANLLGLSTKAR